MRTQPMFTEMSALGWLLPSTNSVEPPPMSTTKNGPCDTSTPNVAPRNDNSASSSPGNSSGRVPSARSAPSKNTWLLAASRAALVAAARVRTTACWRIASPYSVSTASVRAIASGCSEPLTSTPWPSRVICMRRSSSRPCSSVISKRTELVPMSTAATFTVNRRCLA